MNPQQSSEQRRRVLLVVKPPATLLALCVLALLIQLVAGGAIWFIFDSWEQRGLFGDMFGAVNTLFSGLAFAGVVYTIFVQLREQIGARREREESRAALQTQVEGLRQALATQAAQMTFLETALRELQTQATASTRAATLVALSSYLQSSNMADKQLAAAASDRLHALVQRAIEETL